MISKVQFSNYKSYRESTVVEFGPGVNVIVGQNNAGKTALAEMVSFRAGVAPHRGLKTVPTRATPHIPPTPVIVIFQFTQAELLDMLREIGPILYMPVTEAVTLFDQFLTAGTGAQVAEAQVEYNLQTAQFTAVQSSVLGNVQLVNSMSMQAVRYDFLPSSARPVAVRNSVTMVDPNAMVPARIAQILRGRVYGFRAERLNIGESPISWITTLSPDASNLAQVLNALQSSNPTLWERFLGFVRNVLPQVTLVTVPPSPINPGQVRILVWPHDPATARDDLAVTLTESGTGIGQVLAALYVVVTSDVPRTIVIDEPQSFLHPGAVRRLFDVFRLHPQHQYIITTHSPSAVSAAAPTTLTLVRADAGESHAEQLNPAETRDLRKLLHDVGARLSDVFGADRILWVEGRTEEVCFPLIMAAQSGMPASATIVLGVRDTGSFARPNAAAVFELYKRLSHGPRLLPPAVGFIFDREGRKPTERADLSRQSGGRIRFTHRRMYENYILNPAAIASVVNQIEGFTPEPVAEAIIADWIQANKWERRYIGRTVPEAERTEERWLAEVDGGRLLSGVFAALSEERSTYDKVEHGYGLTAWVCQHDPEAMAEISTMIAGLLRDGATAVTA